MLFFFHAPLAAASGNCKNPPPEEEGEGGRDKERGGRVRKEGRRREADEKKRRQLALALAMVNMCTSRRWRLDNKMEATELYNYHRKQLKQVHDDSGAQETTDEDDVGTHISCLYPEILAIIFGMLEVRDRGRAAQVCQSWREAAYHKSVWRSCEPKLHLRRANPSLFPSLVRRGIRRVQILSLRRSLRDVTQGLPNIESLDLSGCFNVTDIGISHALTADVPTLKRLNLSLCKQITDSSLSRLAQFCRQLQELDLGGCCNVTNAGLLLIAWGLKSLKSLNLRSCWHVSDLGIASLAGLGSDAEGNLALEHLGLQVKKMLFLFLFWKKKTKGKGPDVTIADDAQQRH